MTHICVSDLTIIGSDNDLSPGRRQAIVWTNAGVLFIRTLGTNFSEILGEINSFSFPEMHLKMSSAKWRLFGLGLNKLKLWIWKWTAVHDTSGSFTAWNRKIFTLPQLWYGFPCMCAYTYWVFADRHHLILGHVETCRYISSQGVIAHQFAMRTSTVI